MKILHIVPSYVPAYRHGGPIRSVHALNRALAAAGMDVAAYTTNIDGPGVLDVPLEHERALDGVKVTYFPLTFRPWVYSFALHRALAEHIREYDVVHITSVFLSASTLGAHYARKFGKPYLISPRGSLMKEPLAMKSSLKKKLYLSLIEKRNLSGAAAIHFTAEKEREEYIAAGFPMKKSEVIPNAYEEEEVHEPVDVRKKFNLSKGAPIVLFLGRINWKKGFDTLIPAFKEVKKEVPEAVLIVAGDDEGGYKDEVKVQVSEEGMKIGDDVKFTDGMVWGAEKASLLEAATAFVLPSYSENFGMAPTESLAHGTAVVVTRNVGIADDVKKARAGVVVEEKTEANKRVREFADATVKVLREEKVEKKMGARGRALVADEYAPAKVAEQFAAAYEAIINGAR